MRHETIEKSLNLMMVLIVVAISFGGLVEIVPLMFSADATEPAEGIEPYSPLRLAGRDIYVREGCYNCHSQMIRPFRSETERYTIDHFSSAPNVPAPILPALAVATATIGIACT
jgi:cytochrome c oxidase cbb3-type subunit 2